MKTKLIKLMTVLLGVVLLGSCVKVFDDEVNTGNEETAYDLDFSNVSKTSVRIKLTDEAGTPHKGVKITFWDKSPIAGGHIMLKGVTDHSGNFETDYNMPSYITEVVMELGYIGLPDFLIIPVKNLSGQIAIAGYDHPYHYLSDELIPHQSVQDGVSVDVSGGRIAATTVLKALGTYNSGGKPNYLLTRDLISSQLLEYINASLPERQPVPVYHPAYLAEDSETNLNIVEKADVWMTFVTEGAGYLNSLGFYTYPTDNPPNSVDEIGTIFIGFPNASLSGSGGQLLSGDKIHLGQFEPGISIGFVLIADGYNSSTATVKEAAQRYYSHNHLNPETLKINKQHTVTLYDESNQLFLIGFEDLNRNSGSDNDFNDAVFYITSNPVTAISTENIKPVDKPGDTDKDGVSNVYDEFPEDPKYAYKYDYPASGTYGTFAFEDLWPEYGDYDFNDLVVDYRFTQYADATNKIASLQSEFVIRAIGASYQNGFGFSTNLNPNLVASVKGSKIVGNLVKISTNGTESGQAKATFIVSDKVHSSFNSFGIINTNAGGQYNTPDTIRTTIDFTRGVSLSELGSAPYNPFLIINQTRGREVHMPGYQPTDLVDLNYFGMGNDNSNPAKGIYYRSREELPWAMNLPVSFDYPLEGADIRDPYLNFTQWAKSGGFSYMDWYMNLPGYRDKSKIYSRE